MDGEPRILAIETSGRLGSVCVALGRSVRARADLPTDTRHAAELHATIDRLVRRQGWLPDRLSEVHVSAGPGSFTGVRIGITVARTLAWATGVRLVRVPTVDAIARNALHADPPPTHLAVILDAKRRQVFTALFRLRQETAPFGVVRTGYEKIVDATLADPREFLRQTTDDGSRIAVLGEGIDYHRDAIEQTGATILPPALWPARAEGVLEVGSRLAESGDYCPLGDCVPIYIRLPEPEERWRARQENAPPNT